MENQNRGAAWRMQVHSDEAATRVTERLANRLVPGGVPSPPGTRGDRPRLLLVGSDAVLCRAMSRILSSDFSVTTAFHAWQAFRFAAAEQFAVIVCDRGLSDMSAELMVETLEVLDPYQASRVVLLSGGPSEPNLRGRSWNGLSIQKPFDAATLREAARSLLRRRAGAVW
jgi:DNA-binding response OmpR family regulator